MKKLAAGTAVAAGLWGYLYQFNQSPGLGKYTDLDRYILYEIVVVFGFAALVMLFSRDHWTTRGIGLLFTSIGTVATFVSAIYLAWGGDPDTGTREAFVDLGRVGFGFGGILVFFGLVWYVLGRIFLKGKLGRWNPGDWDRRIDIRRDCDKLLIGRLERAEILLSRYRGMYGELEGDL